MVFPLLSAVGYLGGVAQGTSYVLAGAEQATGIPFHSGMQAIVREAFKELRSGAQPVIAGLQRPLPRVVAGPLAQLTASFRTRGQASLPAPSTHRQQQAQTAVEQSTRQAEQAERRALALDAQAARERDAMRRVALANKARASRRLAAIARRVAAKASEAAAAADYTLAVQIAETALSLAQTAQSPPTDARAELASSDLTDEEKAAFLDLIDDMNRPDEPDYDALVARLIGEEPIEGEIEEEEFVEGHDKHAHAHHHEHDHSHAGGDCACGGECHSCQQAAKALPTTAGPPALPAMTSLDWESAQPAPIAGADASGPLDWDSPAPRVAVAGPDEPAGFDWVSKPKRPKSAVGGGEKAEPAGLDWKSKPRVETAGDDDLDLDDDDEDCPVCPSRRRA